MCSAQSKIENRKFLQYHMRSAQFNRKSYIENRKFLVSRLSSLVTCHSLNFLLNMINVSISRGAGNEFSEESRHEELGANDHGC